MDDVDPNDFYTFNNGNTRYAVRSKLDIRKYCFSNRTARAWNNLAIKTRKAKSVNTFKRLLDMDHEKDIGVFEYD